MSRLYTKHGTITGKPGLTAASLTPAGDCSLPVPGLQSELNAFLKRVLKDIKKKKKH